MKSESDFYDFVHGEKYEAQYFSHEPEVKVDFYDLYDYDEDLALTLLDKPEVTLAELEAEFNKKVRIFNLMNTTQIREVEARHIGKLVQVEAIITAASIPDATITIAVYTCPVCGVELNEPQNGYELEPPNKCVCDNRRKFKLERDKCTRIDTQTLQLQERPEELPPGEIPEPLSTVLRESLVRSTSPGDRVKIVGVVKAKPTKATSLSDVKILEANSVEVLNRNNIETRLTEERIQQIKALSQQPNLEEILIDSYCPSIYGWRHVKKAILRCVFGGVDKYKEGSFVRGWANGMMAGDPGLAKTALLLFGKNVCQRGIYDTGPGVTGVGLTAALVKIDEKFVLAAGTLALGDRGNAFIDEFEKMNKEDRKVIHVPMENGIIKVSKGGLTATLNSRCSIVAAMNPVDGRYNISKTLLENLRKNKDDFPDSLVSRFDWIFIMVDEAKAEVDRAVAKRMLGTDKQNVICKIPLDLFKDYITYSKHVNPVIPLPIKEKMEEYYERKRQEMKNDISKIFTPRQLESIERLIEARARMHLREEATMEDFNDTIWLHEIYINETWTDPYTGKVDTGPMVGIPAKSKRLQREFLPIIVESMYHDGKGNVGLDGELYVMEGELVKEVVARSGGRIDSTTARDLIREASQDNIDILFSPGVGRIKISGPDRNRMLGAEPTTLNSS